MSNLTFKNLSDKNKTRTKEYLSFEEMEILYLTTAIGGEAGELLNKVKKTVRFTKFKKSESPSLEDIGDEMADVIIYIDLLATKMGIELDEAVMRKFNATSDKYNFKTKIENS